MLEVILPDVPDTARRAYLKVTLDFSVVPSTCCHICQ